MRTIKLAVSRFPITAALLLALLLPTPSVAAVSWLQERGTPISDPQQTVNKLVQTIGSEPRAILLGEASHGTQEYYQWRRKLTQALVAAGAIDLIAVEGDWAPLRALNAYIKDKPDAPASLPQALAELQRWPQWMWKNQEIALLGEWLREWNLQQPPAQRIGFYGLDAYAPDAAAKQLQHYLNKHGDKPAADLSAIRCFIDYADDIPGYIQASRRQQTPTEQQLAAWAVQLSADDAPFAVQQSLQVLLSAHRHYLSMGRPGPDSWNYRAEHMQHTLERLLDHYGEHSRAAVWAHNTHIGDARATTMAAQGQVNIGQLARQQWGEEQVFALGFASHRGTVVAGQQWGAAQQSMTLPEAAAGSLEAALDQYFPEGALLLLANPPEQAYRQAIGHRAVGVVYRPETDRHNYVPTVLPARYDALLFIPETRALQGL